MSLHKRSERLKLLKGFFLEILEIETDFTENSRGRKTSTVPHCIFLQLSHGFTFHVNQILIEGFSTKLLKSIRFHRIYKIGTKVVLCTYEGQLIPSQNSDKL